MIRGLPLALAALAAAGTAQAQAYQCRAPAAISVPEIRPNERPRTLPVTGFTLALTWAPEFCKGRESAAAHRFQCSGRSARFGMVVHGLWPESRASWPQWCRTRLRPSRSTVRGNMCMMPSARLQAWQWAKHGSCMVRRPSTYFKITRILWDSLQMPDFDALSRRKGLKAGALREAFLLANPGWPASAVGIHADRRGWLEELRLCYGKDYRPTACDRRRHGLADEAALRIWRGL